MIQITLQLPLPLIHHTMQVQLGPLGQQVAVLTNSRGVPGYGSVEILPAIAELILTAGRHQLGIGAKADVGGESLFPQQRGAQQVAGSIFHPNLKISPLPHIEARHLRSDIYRRGRRKVAGCLKDGTFLSVIECHLFYIIQRELP